MHAAGGVVGTHHMHLDAHYEALLDGGTFGIDLFELGGAWMTSPTYGTDVERRDRDAHGYPAQDEDELHPLLVRWDRLTARGLFLTGYGAADLHVRFDRPTNGWMNRWLSWILAPDDSPEALIESLRAGRVVACASRGEARVELLVDGRPWMGKVVATDRAAHRVTVRVAGALPGSTVRWIRGELVRATADDPGDPTAPPTAVAVRQERLAEPAAELALDLDTTRAVFVRAELRAPSGRPVALSNPVVFVPYRPEPWPPPRVAFDWGGATGTDPADLPAALAAAPPVDPRAIPARKRRVLDVAVGDPASEGVLDPEGFGAPYDGLLTIHYREVTAPGARFTLEVPRGEPSWLRLAVLDLAPAWATVSVDGEVLGELSPSHGRTFELAPVEPGAEGTAARTVELALPARSPDGRTPNLLRLAGVELWVGDGVVDY